MRSEHKSHRENSILDSSSKQVANRKLYEALLCIYQFSCLEDLFQLQTEAFLQLCNVNELEWYLNEDIFKNHSLLDHNFKRDLSSISHYSCSLNYKNQIYGELIFIAPKIKKSQQRSFEKISAAISSSLYFMQNKKKLETSKKQWEFTFDSFHKAFCITDNYFSILKFNKFFSRCIQKSDVTGLNFFNVFPFPIKPRETDGLWTIHGVHQNEKICLEFILKTIFLKNERLPIRLIKITNVTEKIKMQKKIEEQSRQRELGLIKASVAHELNNPLAGIKLLLHLISNNLSPREHFIKETLQEMDEALKRCQGIIQNLLQASRPSAEEKEVPLHSRSSRF